MTQSIRDDQGAEGAGFRPRAGTLTILFLIGGARVKGEMLAVLAEIATGVRIPAVPAPRPDDAPERVIDPDATLEVTDAGRDMLDVVGVFTSWLRQCPAGAMDFVGEAYPSVRALLEGWGSALVHAFAAEPLTLAAATERIGVLGPDATADRIGTLEAQGLLEALPRGAEPRYAVSDWLRRGIAPILAAMRMELLHPPASAAPIAVADIETAFRLALPLLRLPADAEGSCALAVQLEPEVSEDPVGVTVGVEEGRVASLEPGVDEGAGALAGASVADWLETLTEIGVDRVRTSGDRRLAGLLVDGLHETLFGVPLRAVFGDPSEWMG
jgi:hypothetical protein